MTNVVIIGGGHNGLTAAAYLGKAGKKVLLLEARDQLGGAAGTSEFHSGFSVSECAHLLTAMHPQVMKDLKLDQHGLSFAAKNLSTISLSAEGNHVHIDSDHVSGVSGEDASAYSALQNRLMRFSKLLADTLTERPPKLADSDFRDQMMLMKLALKVRLLGRDDMRELLRVGAINTFDVLEEELESPLLKGALVFDSVLGAFAGPRSPNTVLGYLYRHVGTATGQGPAIVQGGMGSVSDALASAAASFGVECRTGARVEKIQVKDGAVTGLQLSGGEKIEADCIVSNLDAKSTFADLVGYQLLETDFARRIHNHRAKGTTAKLHLALSGLPEVAGLSANDLGQRLVVAPSPVYVEQAFDCVKYGEASANPAMEITIPTVHDATLAPEGQHVLSAVVQYAPHQPKQEDCKTQFQQSIMQTLEAYLPGVGSKVVATELLMPQDIEARYGNTGGHWHHGEYSLDQFLMLRPVPGAAQYATPIGGLYLCGATAHPGGGVMGVAGRNCADAVLAGGQ